MKLSLLVLVVSLLAALVFPPLLAFGVIAYMAGGLYTDTRIMAAVNSAALRDDDFLRMSVQSNSLSMILPRVTSFMLWWAVLVYGIVTSLAARREGWTDIARA